MSKFTPISGEIHQYILSTSLREPDLLRRLREQTAPMPESEMQIAPEQGQFMAFLLRLMDARRTIEIGVYTGYSTLCTALALPEDGRVIACDVNEEWAEIAQEYWEEAGIRRKIDFRLAPAEETLRRLLDDGEEGRFDFIFVDADKQAYPLYYELGLRLLRTGGVMALDNVLRAGRVIRPDADDLDTLAIRDLNERMLHDDRVDLTLVPIADGLTLVRKR